MELDIDIPDSWQKRRIRDVGEVVTGRTPSTKREDYYGGDYSLISPADLDNGKYVVTAHKQLTEIGFMECRALPKDSVLVGCIGNVGKLGMVSDERSATNQQINAVICNKSHDSHFIYYCLHGNRARLEWAADKTTLPILNKTNFENFEIATPPLAEQQTIAGVLGLVQRALEQQERLIALTMELKKALLHQLFTQGLRGEPQKMTEIGPVPESWEVVDLGSLATKISKGSSPRWQGFEYVPEGVLFVRSQNVGFGRMEFSDRVFVPKKFNEHEKRSILRTEDILINLVGASIGRVALGTPEIEGANCNQAVGFVRLERERYFKTFIVCYLLSPIGQQQMFFQKKDIARANLTLLDLRSFSVPVPLSEESAEIARIFDEIERKIEICEQRKTALTDLFRTMLHQLMTAQIRVDKLDIEELIAGIS